MAETDALVQPQTPQSAPPPLAPREPRRAFSRQQLILVSLAFVIFAAVAVWAILSGFSSGKSTATYRNVQKIQTALQYYYQDQDAYPTADQFYNQNALTVSYLSAMPQPLDSSGVCKAYPQFYYTPQGSSNYQLQFCLVKPVSGLSAGLHQATADGIK